MKSKKELKEFSTRQAIAYNILTTIFFMVEVASFLYLVYLIVMFMPFRLIGFVIGLYIICSLAQVAKRISAQRMKIYIEEDGTRTNR